MLNSEVKPLPGETSRLAIHRFALGTRWMLLLSILIVPVSYLNSLVLGRIAPKALGLYGLLLVSSSLVRLLMIGGGQSVVRFLPGMPAHKRISFVWTYGLLVGGWTILFLGAVGWYPGLVSWLVRRPLDPTTVRYLLLFIPLMLLAHFSRSLLQARMEIKWMSITSKLVPAVNLVGFTLLYLFRHRVPYDRLGEAILGIFCVAQFVALALASYHVYYRFLKVEPVRMELFLPAGFWSFSLFVSLSMIVVTILDNFDQALIFSKFEIGQLGIYRASLTTAEFVRWLPLLVTQSILPLFSHLLADPEQAPLSRVYRRVIRYNTAITTTLALLVVLFGKLLLLLFGPEYMQAESILVLLAGFFMFSSLSTVNSAFIVATGRVGLGLTSGVIGSVIQILVSLLLIGQWGLEGAALGKVLNFSCITVLNAWFVSRIAGLRPDRTSLQTLGLASLIILLSRWIVPESLAWFLLRNGVFMGMFALFVLRSLDHEDYRSLWIFIWGQSAYSSSER